MPAFDDLRGPLCREELGRGDAEHAVATTAGQRVDDGVVGIVDGLDAAAMVSLQM